MRHACLLVTLLLVASLPVSSSSNSPPVEVNISTTKFDWLSNETVELSVEVLNSQFNQQYYANYTVTDLAGNIVQSGSYNFVSSGPNTQFPVLLSQLYDNSNFYFFNIEIIDSSSTVLTSSSASFMVFQNTIMPQVSNLLAFGDSLSDMGNAKDSILNVPDVPPYWQGRFSNGPVWLEYVSEAYGLTTTVGSLSEQGDNRAFGGAQTGQGFSYLLLPNVGTQIGNYLANVQTAIPSNDIIALWAGGNDFLYGTANSDTIVANMESHLRQLHEAGARQFIIPNLPPLEKTPEILSRSQSQQSNIASEVISYNTKLSNLISDLIAELSINVYFIDAWSLFNDIVANSGALGIVNTQDPACSAPATLLPLPICNSNSEVANNPDEYLFFDKAHPTRVMHEFIAYFAIQTIGIPDTDGDGVIDSIDLCEWTGNAEMVDIDGCSWEQLDDDLDGVANGVDICPNTQLNAIVDVNGCSAEQRDSDDDGLNDAIDPCPFSNPTNDHDSDGCTDDVDVDDDNDMVLDVDDNCPRGLIGQHMNDLDEDGCADSEDVDIDGDLLDNTVESSIGTDLYDEDTDGDGVIDGIDKFPLDPLEWLDSDLDGCGDNSDEFPYDDTECADTDGDGYGDNYDKFPNDETEWLDYDSDGVGDNRDACPTRYGLSISPEGCPDRDGDGFSDTTDMFPDDMDEWADSDGDGFGDNGDRFPYDPAEWNDFDNDTYGDNSDVFPSNPAEWNDTDGDTVGDNSDAFPLDPSEWQDSDGDGCGDNQDIWPFDPEECFDRDVDGVGDNADAFPDNRAEWSDADGDGLGDNSDLFPNDSMAKYDSDGDGIANYYDAFPNNPNMDNWFDLMMRIGAVIFVVGAAFIGFKTMKQRSDEGPDWDNQDELYLAAAENNELDRPTGPPPPGSFQ